MKSTTAFAAVLAVFLVSAGSALAASFVLTNGGLGQAALNTQQFGVAVCNKSSQTLATAVPVLIQANGQSATVSSVAPIASGQCEYSYVAYSQFGMQVGKTYAANVTIDPQHTMTSGANSTANYSITVPGQGGNNVNLTANADSQLADPFAIFWNWIVSIVKGI